MLPGWRGRDKRPRHQPETQRPAGENVSITMAPAPNVAQEYHCPDWAFDRSNPLILREWIDLEISAQARYHP